MLSNAITVRALVKIADCVEQLRILSLSRPFTRSKGLTCETSCPVVWAIISEES